MKLEYTKLALEVIKVDLNDVLTASGDLGADGDGADTPLQPLPGRG